MLMLIAGFPLLTVSPGLWCSDAWAVHPIFVEAAEHANAEDGVVLTKPIDLGVLTQKVGEMLGAGAQDLD
jgi:hypothetical protein